MTTIDVFHLSTGSGYIFRGESTERVFYFDKSWPRHHTGKAVIELVWEHGTVSDLCNLNQAAIMNSKGRHRA